MCTIYLVNVLCFRSYECGMFPTRHITLPISGLAQFCTILMSVGDFLTAMASLRNTARATLGLACTCSSVPEDQPLASVWEYPLLLVWVSLWHLVLCSCLVLFHLQCTLALQSQWSGQEQHFWLLVSSETDGHPCRSSGEQCAGDHGLLTMLRPLPVCSLGGRSLWASSSHLWVRC